MAYLPAEERIFLAGLSADTPPEAVPKAIRLRAFRYCMERDARWKWLKLNVCAERRGGRIAVPSLREPIAAARFIAEVVPDLVHDQQENILVVVVDTRNRPLGLAHVHRGGRASSMVEVASVFQPVVIAAPATGLIVAHNHPSGEARPSAEDLALVERLQTAANVLGVRLLDFLVLTLTEVWSSTSGREFRYAEGEG
jgi:DNA repair protein RadC